MSLALTAASMATAGAAAQASGAAEFNRRVAAYVELRDEHSRGQAALSETPQPGEIVAAERALAARIRAARPAARPGDVFGPVAEQLRAALKPEFKGTSGANTRGVIRDEGPGPGAVNVKVNDDYPKSVPLGTVPSNILKVLPPLPDGLEYRIVERTLILRDVRANLIIDVLPRAIP